MRHFDLEPMEQRRLLSGNVTASIDGSGTLVVKGDNKSNDVIVIAGAGDTLVVGKPGTTVNGGTAGADFPGFPNISVNTGNGDDTVELDDLNGQNASVDTGNGEDQVLVQTIFFPGQSSVNNLNIDTGNGNDAVTFNFNGQSVIGNANIDLGNGSDKLTVLGNIAIGGDAHIHGGNGPYTLDVSGVTGLSIGGTIDITGFESVIL